MAEPIVDHTNPQQPCPRCHEQIGDLWEYKDGAQIIECPWCEKEIALEIETERFYRLRPVTRRLPSPPGEPETDTKGGG